ncbi:RDD family protein [Duganella sp. FT92W]|uniref:RDD family protein n=1 Tax=Pseudoduganella rivuli TaxID=2666085 RepID=A0A7X2IN09_9BURK|nr:RDD family protein [Pseudoduganella rivuli]
MPFLTAPLTLIDGRLSLTTPEGTRLLLTPAGPAARAWAWAIDFLVWLVFIVGVTMLLPRFKLAQGLFLIVLFASYWGYPILCEVYCRGQTLGKRIMGLEVRRANGLPVGWRDSTLRNLMLVADFMPMLYATGLLAMLFDRQFRRLGDIVAGTLVVYRDKPPVRHTTAAGDEPVAPQPLPFPLPPHQQRALADLFERESTLPRARMEELGDIAEPLTGATGAESLERLRAFAAGLRL